MFPINLHNDPSSVYINFIRQELLPAQSPTEKVEQVFDTMKSDLSSWLLKNNEKFAQADTALSYGTLLCLGAALLATIGGIGAATCPSENKKTRLYFALLGIVSAILSIASACILCQMQAEVRSLNFF